MPPVKKPDNEGLLLMIGQLLESTQAAADGLKSIGTEVRTNATAIIVAAKAVEQVEKKLAELDEIVRDAANPDSLVLRAAAHHLRLDGVEQRLQALHAAVDVLKTAVSDLGAVQIVRQQRWSTAKRVTVGALAFVAFVVTQVMVVIGALIQAGKW